MVDPEELPPARRGPFALAGVLVALPILALMWVGSYARAEPALFGFPFFYWYQLLWVFVAAGCTSIAYRVITTEQRRRRAVVTRGGRR